MASTRDARPVLGLRLPYVMATLKAVGEKAEELIQDFIADPELAIEAQVEGILDDAEQERRHASDAAVRTGRRLVWLKLHPGPEGFAHHVARSKMSPRTARNKMALALFADKYPELYERIKGLGPTKLYRIAVIDPDKIHKINVNDPIELPRGNVPLRQLTSREFEAWLRDQVPPAEREPWIRRAQRHLRTTERVLEKNHAQPVDAADLAALDAQVERFTTWTRETLQSMRAT